jgi:hypothetical protein
MLVLLHQDLLDCLEEDLQGESFLYLDNLEMHQQNLLDLDYLVHLYLKYVLHLHRHL